MVLNTKTPVLTTRFEEALVLANKIHRTQIRKGSGVPYISHLLSVAALVLEDGGDEDEAIAALLHDAVEDGGGAATRKVILEKFGERVTSIIDSCTECDMQPKPPWRDRKLLYLDKIRHASPSVLRVSMADKLHNMRSILADWEREGDEVWLKFKGGKEGSLWFYGCLLEIYREGCAGFLVGELARIINLLGNNYTWGSLSF